MASTYLQKKDEEALRLKQQQGATAGNAALGDASQQAASLADATKTTSAGGFTPSAQLQQAQQQVQQMQQQKPGAYQSAITPQLQAQFEAIMNRQPFQYDLGSDPMFQQASDLYVQQGRRAMQDAIGEAVGLTGGYGNSYAQGVGQAAYGNYLQQLGALAPQYQQQAYARWQNEGADMLSRYNMLAAREESDYGRYQDALNNYWAEVDRAQQAENELYNREYGEHMDKLAYEQQQAEWAQQLKEYDQSYAQQQAEWAQQQAEWQQYLKEYDQSYAQQQAEWAQQLKEYDQSYAQQQAEWAQQQAEWQQYLKEYDQNYAQEQAEWAQQLKEYDQSVASENRDYAYNLALMMLQGGKMPSADVLAAAGISDADAATIRAMYTPKSSGSSSSGSSSSGSKATTGSSLLSKIGSGVSSIVKNISSLVNADADGDVVMSRAEWEANKDELDPFNAAKKATTLATLPLTKGFGTSADTALKNASASNTDDYNTYVENAIAGALQKGIINKKNAQDLAYKFIKD